MDTVLRYITNTHQHSQQQRHTSIPSSHQSTLIKLPQLRTQQLLPPLVNIIPIPQQTFPRSTNHIIYDRLDSGSLIGDVCFSLE